MNNSDTQNAFAILNEMEKMVATPGVHQENLNIANTIIKTLLNGVIKPAVTSISAKGSGIII